MFDSRTESSYASKKKTYKISNYSFADKEFARFITKTFICILWDMLWYGKYLRSCNSDLYLVKKNVLF